MSTGKPGHNPFANQYVPPAQPASPAPPQKRPTVRKASLGFMGPYFEAFNFLGSDFWYFWGLIFVAMLIGGALPLVLIGPMHVGLGMCLLAKAQGRPFKFELLFKGFDHFMNALIPVLCYIGISFVFIPFAFIGMFGAMAIASSGETVLIVIAALFGVAAYILFIAAMSMINYGMLFASFLVAEYHLEGMDAFKTSFDGVTKNAFGLIAVGIGGAILGLAAMLACYIPVLLIMPVFFVGPFLCYQKIFSGGTAPRRQSMPHKPSF